MQNTAKQQLEIQPTEAEVLNALKVLETLPPYEQEAIVASISIKIPQTISDEGELNEKGKNTLPTQIRINEAIKNIKSLNPKQYSKFINILTQKKAINTKSNYDLHKYHEFQNCTFEGFKRIMAKLKRREEYISEHTNEQKEESSTTAPTNKKLRQHLAKQNKLYIESEKLLTLFIHEHTEADKTLALIEESIEKAQSTNPLIQTIQKIRDKFEKTA